MFRALSVFFEELADSSRTAEERRYFNPAPPDQPPIHPSAPTPEAFTAPGLSALAQMVRDQFAQSMGQPPSAPTEPPPPPPHTDMDDHDQFHRSMGAVPDDAPARDPDEFIDYSAPDAIDLGAKFRAACEWQKRRAAQMAAAYPDCEEAEKQSSQEPGSDRVTDLFNPETYMSVLAYYCHKLTIEGAKIADVILSVGCLPNVGDLRWQLMLENEQSVVPYQKLWDECNDQIQAAFQTALLDVDDYQQMLLALASAVPAEYWVDAEEDAA
jgi:hypothetical protein